MKRNLDTGKKKSKLALDKQTIRELKPVDLQDSAGGVRDDNGGLEPSFC